MSNAEILEFGIELNGTGSDKINGQGIQLEYDQLCK